MRFYHKIKPHHHLSVWAIVLSSVVISGLVYSTAGIENLLAQQSEPSAKTKQFFGFNESDEGREWVMPEACKMQQQQDRMQQLSQEMQSLSSQLNILNQQDSGLTEEQRQLNQQKIQELQQKMSQLQAEMDKLNQSFQAGPSTECKTAIVNQAVTMMGEMLAKMDSRFVGTLNKVETTIEKIEGFVPDLESAGVAAAKIDKIKADIASVKVQLGVLRSFFEKMKASMQKFISTAKANPLSAFEKMQNGGMDMDDTQAAQAANAADTMVAAFEDMVDILDEIQSSGGQ